MEEDIKILEEQLNTYKRHIENYQKEECLTRVYYELKSYATALENLIKGYREYKNFYHRRLKEWRTKFENQEKHFLNELDEYDEEREKLKKQLDNSIPKSKVKEKIEGLRISGGGDGKDRVENLARELAIEVLQELMEDK